jgi:two-component system, cell cycle response regulator
MQDNWEAITATADPRAPTLAAQGKRAQLVQLAGANVGALYKLDGTLVIGRASDADLRIEGNGISRHHARVKLGDFVVEFEDLGSTNGSFVNGERVARRELQSGDKIQLGTATILKFGYQDEIDEDFHRMMFESASRDMLTELCNKRFFLERMSTEFAFAVRHGTPLSLIVFAIDDFRALQEAHGPMLGNRILAGLAKAVLSIIRTEDVLAHCGGGEFAMLSRGIEPTAALAISERVRQHVEQQPFDFEGRAGAVRVCLGLSGMPHPTTATPQEMMARAQQALELALRAGRTVVVSE